jgi:uncharacterized protein YkwD
MRRLGTAFLLSLCGLALTGAATDTRFVVKVGQFGPRTEVRVARPTIQWQVWAADQTSRVTSVDLKLDGKRVDAQYDARSRAVKYTPTAPLSPGVHRVECRITFEGGAHFDKNWDTRIADAPLKDFPAPSAQQAEALSVTNELRRALGLASATSDDRLNFAAFQHSDYLAQNNLTGHGEKPGTPGFLAATGAERLEVYGWMGSSWEDVNFGSRSVTESVKDLFNAPYHRIPFMQPGAIPFGAGYSDQRTTLEFGASEETGTVISPNDGQTGVPISWRNYERPNPLRMHGTTQAETGYPIVLGYFGPTLPRLRNVSASLTGPNGDQILCWLNTPENDDALVGAAILIPRLPLRPGTRYTASFSATDENGRPIERTATFTTAGPAPKKGR